MLNDLYNYAIKNKLTGKPGYKFKPVKGYISLSKAGEFLCIEPAAENEVMCPDIGSVAYGPSKSNVIAEKAEIVLLLDEKRKTKHEFFKKALAEASEYDEELKLCVNALENDIDIIKSELKEKKYKNGDVISFKVNNNSIIGRASYEKWWNEFRKAQTGTKNDNVNAERCMITGELCKGVDTVPKVSGLSVVGGHTSGDALICFDKDAFCSYNLKQAHNAVVSEEAIVTVNTALKELIEKAPILANAKVLHWYDESLKEKKDYFDLLGWGSAKFETDEIQSTEEVRALIGSILNGEQPVNLKNRYYILLLSGAGGRVMIRGYMQGKCEDLYKAIDAWYSDLSLKSSDGSDKPVKMFGIYTRLPDRQKAGKSIGERISKNLSGISPKILYAVINNTPLPDTMAVKALSYIRSAMVDSSNDTDTNSNAMPRPDKICCRILKAWLIRKYGKEKTGIMEELNQNSPSKAYHVGRMMAVFAAVQREALGDVGAGVVERYYASACTSPALVIGKLSSLSQYHLGKIQNESYKVRYKKMLEEISQKIGTSIPSVLSLEEQSQFALGYYQQCADMFKKREEKKEDEKQE